MYISGHDPMHEVYAQNCIPVGLHDAHGQVYTYI